MNYEHAFHAGNPADVLKHAALVLVLQELTRREAPLHFIDTHAGAGGYHLQDPTGEWTQGIAKLVSRSARRRLPELAPYLDLACPEGQEVADYPGSPAIAQALLREQDKLELYEVVPEVKRALDQGLRVQQDPRVRTASLDGYEGLGRAKVEPGAKLVVLLDPPYEALHEWDDIDRAVQRAARKHPGAVFMLWYPIKLGPPHEGRPEALMASLEDAGTKGVAVELTARGGMLLPRTQAPRKRPTLIGSGLIFIGAPSRAVAKLAAAVPELARSLARQEDGMAWEARWMGWG